jgi:hypothetical protein
MIKMIVGMFLLAALLSGCANQQLQTAQFGSAPANEIEPTTKPPAQVSQPVAQKPKKKRLAADTRPRKKVSNPPALPERKPAAAPNHKQDLKELVSLNETKSNCKTSLPKLPVDADRRSATVGVQCFFISRGEYLTSTGAVKPLR